VIKQTVNWPSTTQSIKGAIMGGWARTMRYLGEKFSKWKKGKAQAKESAMTASEHSEENDRKDGTGKKD
jgi:translocator assembly and maintenance protein 41